MSKSLNYLNRAKEKFNEASWSNPLNLLENKTSTSKDFLHIGEEILEELAQLKIDLSSLNASDILERWNINFNESFNNEITNCCIIKSPFEAKYNDRATDPETTLEEIAPTKLDDGNLLSESILSENECLATLSPGRLPSNRQANFSKNTSKMSIDGYLLSLK